MILIMQKLVEEAQAILHPKDAPPDPDTSPGKTVKFAEPGPETEATTSRAKPIPGPLISTGPLLDSEPIFPSNEPSSAVAKVSETQALTEIKKARAQKLLQVLSSNNENG
jgi:hypothetical protein